jgi:hypothetical protein
MSLNQRFSAIVTDELSRASVRLGKRILQLYLADLSAARAKELAADSGFLGELVERAIADACDAARLAGRDITNPAAIVTLASTHPSTATRDSLTVLDHAVRSAPTLHGISLLEAAAVLKRRLGRAVAPGSIRLMLRRNTEFHSLMVRRGRVQLRSELIVEKLAERHSQKLPPLPPKKPSPKLPPDAMLRRAQSRPASKRAR